MEDGKVDKEMNILDKTCTKACHVWGTVDSLVFLTGNEHGGKWWKNKLENTAHALHSIPLCHASKENQIYHHISILLPTSKIPIPASLLLYTNLKLGQGEGGLKSNSKRNDYSSLYLTTAHLPYMILCVPQKCSHFRAFKANETFISVTFILWMI